MCSIFQVLSLINEDRRLGHGRQALYDQMVKFLQDCASDLRDKYRLLRLTVDVLARKGSELELSPLSKIKSLVSELLDHGDKDYRKTAHEFMEFSDRKLKSKVRLSTSI